MAARVGRSRGKKVRRIRRRVLEDLAMVPPFNQRAAELTIGDTTLNFYHERLMKEYFEKHGYQLELGESLTDRMQVFMIREAADDEGELIPYIVYRDSLWFDEEFLDYFITEAQKTGRACRAAVPADDKCYQTYTFKLAHNLEASYTADERPIYTLDLWYLPRGFTPDITTIVIPSDSKEKGFYTVPDFMASNEGDLTHHLPTRAVLFIETWFHVYIAAIIFGVFTRASRVDEAIEEHNLLSLRLLWRAVVEQKQVLSTSAVVEVGRNTTIHPSAIITGPAKIGDNCNIGPGVIIDNATIGDNVTIDSGCVVSLSTIGNNCFLPFRASIYLTALMDSTIVAQNTCLQMCVIGRNSFIGAGITFTDFNLIGLTEKDEKGRVLRTVPRPIGAANQALDIEDTGQTVLGGAVGHNCRLGSGLIVMPGRMVESDTLLFASPQRRVINRSIGFEESDHHYVKGGVEAHRRMYPRHDDAVTELMPEEGWDEW